ncbi:MAG TPA: beta-N-acetylhexosaminidase, partial [Ruminococcaceae bacterium]|nr:beta-N-acetylhexosaminidase [Oscillospiraceae bacterium]
MKNHFGVMIDCSRNAVMKPAYVKHMTDLLSELGYNTLMLYIEDTYEVDDNPYFGHWRGRYTREELKEMDRYAQSKGMELIPCIQTLAHLGRLFRWQTYRQINDIDDILLVGDERVYELIDKMFSSLSQSLTTRTVNIGMDE